MTKSITLYENRNPEPPLIYGIVRPVKLYGLNHIWVTEGDGRRRLLKEYERTQGKKERRRHKGTRKVTFEYYLSTIGIARAYVMQAYYFHTVRLSYANASYQ